MIPLNVQNETSRLKAVLLGTAQSNGPVPTVEASYDPRSKEHILAGTYPDEGDMVKEMEAFEDILKKYDVEVYRPQLIENYNQIFSRDIAFVIGDKFVKSNILPDREKEQEAIAYITEQIAPEKLIRLDEKVHVEGGDIMLWGPYIFVGTYSGADYPDYITARTNSYAVDALRDLFPDSIVKPFELKKSNDDSQNNALHLDCCFQPVGDDKAIIHKEGFLKESDYRFLINLIGEENMFHIDREEMCQMYCNIFSIAPNVVVSEQHFKRLNTWLRQQGFTVEEVPYAEIGKQGGLLRCSTMPLIRE